MYLDPHLQILAIFDFRHSSYILEFSFCLNVLVTVVQKTGCQYETFPGM